MHQIVLNPDRTVNIPHVGTYVTYQGKSYQVLKTVTYQEQDPNNGLNVIFTTDATLLEVTDEGDDVGNMLITVRTDEVTEI